MAWLLDEFPLELVDIPKLNGMTPGIDYPETARMYPHHFKGEGQFVAKFRFVGEHKLPKLRPARSNLAADQRSLWQIFQKEHLKVDLKGDLQTFGDQLYLLPLGLPDLSKVKIARNGLHLGTFKKKRFEPSFALGLALQPSEVKNKLELSQQDFEVYVGGETLQIKESLPNGWYQLLIHGNGLGFAKLANQTLKNYFPKGLRFR